MKKFIRKKEDFKCLHCGLMVKGDGYTNHCPKCLYSSHVDNNPGDRQNDCGGLMRPVRFEKKNREERVIHRCIKCGIEKANKLSRKDNFEALMGL